MLGKGLARNPALADSAALLRYADYTAKRPPMLDEDSQRTLSGRGSAGPLANVQSTTLRYRCYSVKKVGECAT